MTQQTDAAQIAAFLASRGVTRVAEGAASLPTDRRFWRDAVRAPRGAEEVLPDPTKIIRVAAIDSFGREYLVNGLGEWIATE